MKKLFRAAVIVGLVLVALAALAACGSDSKGLAFVSNGDGTCTVSGLGNCTDTAIVIPSKSPDGDTVTTIGEWAFDGCSSLTSVTIPDSVTSIGKWAFGGCSGLTSVTIPDSVTSIGEMAFALCSNLTSITVDTGNAAYTSIDGSLYTKDEKTLVQYAIGKTDPSFTIPGSVTSIGERAFASCLSLTNVTIGNGVTSIGNWAFAYCSSLTSVTLLDSVTSIGDDAFYGCSSLISVTIPDSVTSIGNRAFYYCPSLTSIAVDADNAVYASIDGNLYTKDGKTLLRYAIGKTATSFTIPSGVTSIGDWAFESCASLMSVTIPSSVTSIGNGAFYDCSRLTSVTIPGSVTSIGWGAFYGCQNLTIYCEAESQPSGWNIYCNQSGCPVVWGYTSEE